jgi:hypothetical protein
MPIPCRCCGTLVEPGSVCPVDGNVTGEAAPEAKPKKKASK